MKYRGSVSTISLIISIYLIVSSIPVRNLRADGISYSSDPLEIVFEQTSTWDEFTQAQITLTNISDQTISDWTLELTFGSEADISNIWNAVDLSDEETSSNVLVVGCESFNSEIPPETTIISVLSSQELRGIHQISD